MAPSLILEVKMHVCPDCDGDGYHIHVGGPGYFDRSFGNYLPSESKEPCERCEGAGEIEAPTCPGCSAPMDTEPVTDPYCPGCGMYASELEGAAV